METISKAGQQAANWNNWFWKGYFSMTYENNFKNKNHRKSSGLKKSI
ncbi:hypothetical protein [Chryseobacterium sp. CBTAP 102]|nr:hypothetical protein [Chryseobacterium sp. CBTAP 102]